jgi:hypothetical protein
MSQNADDILKIGIGNELYFSVGKSEDLEERDLHNLRSK